MIIMMHLGIDTKYSFITRIIIITIYYMKYILRNPHAKIILVLLFCGLNKMTMQFLNFILEN